MIQLISYFWCTNLHTSSLSFITSSIQSNISGNSKLIAVFFYWMKFVYDSTHSYFRCNHIHTSSLTSIICIVNFITFLLQILLWSHSRHCWKIFFTIKVIQVVPFKPIQLFQIILVNTTIRDHMINSYCYRHHCFTFCALQVISFIISLIQSIVVGNSDLRAVVCFE